MCEENWSIFVSVSVRLAVANKVWFKHTNKQTKTDYGTLEAQESQEDQRSKPGTHSQEHTQPPHHGLSTVNIPMLLVGTPMATCSLLQLSRVLHLEHP